MTPSLNERLQRIGFRVVGPEGGEPPRGPLLPHYDIERTLIDSARHIAREKDFRLAGLLLSWAKIHGQHVIVEKLKKFALPLEHSEMDAYLWIKALAAFADHEGIPRWKLLVSRSRAPRHLYPKEISEAGIARKGAVPWLKQWNLLLPADSLRIRDKDIMTPQELLRHNRQYRNRFIFGPCWRADIVTAIEEGAANPSDIMMRAGCSYEPAHRIFTELRMAEFAGGTVPSE